MDITLVAQDRIDAVWPSLKELFDKAAEYTYGRFTGNDLRNKFKNTPSQQLWVAHVDDDVYGFVITGIVDYPQLRALNMFATAGDSLDKWLDLMLANFQLYAQQTGCGLIESIGRVGWSKKFKDKGYKGVEMKYELPVENL